MKLIASSNLVSTSFLIHTSHTDGVISTTGKTIFDEKKFADISDNLKKMKKNFQNNTKIFQKLFLCSFKLSEFSMNYFQVVEKYLNS